MYEKLQRKYKSLVKRNMKDLGVYQSQFDSLIDIYSGMLAQYQILTQRLIDSGLDIEVESQRGGPRKSATATAQEKLRTDLILYTDRLMLNPKTLLMAKQDPGKKHSVLAKALSELR